MIILSVGITGQFDVNPESAAQLSARVEVIQGKLKKSSYSNSKADLGIQLLSTY